MQAKLQNRIIYFIAGLMLMQMGLAAPALSQALPVSGLVPVLFQSTNPIPITIRTDMSVLLSHKRESEAYQPGEVIYTEAGETKVLRMKIRVRGNFRKDTANCDFPPLRINFKKKEIGNTIFGPQDKYRIVTHCRTDDPHFIQYVFREYLVYKIYNVLNSLSLNVRLAIITYEDTSGTYRPLTRYGFILEDEDECAARFNAEKIPGKVSLDEINEHNGLILSVFQFMIGNTDWIVPFSKNLIFLKKGESIYMVPYDFDYCGIVDTDYRNKLGFTSLSEPERVFKGKCYSDAELKSAFKFFRKSKKKMMRLIFSSNQLDRGSLNYMYNYISQFYSIIASKSERKKYFYVNCNP